MKRNLLKISIIIIAVLFVAVFIIVFQTQIYRFRSVNDTTTEIENEIRNLGAQALISNDVPVGAVVLFEDKIIGRGYNTVYRDNNLAGHAEIEALNDAIKTMGIENFMHADRSKITIISSYEPCEMCRGTLNHYRINNVLFLKDKSYYRWLKNHVAGIKYEFSKRQAGSEKIQDSLFLLHPDFPGR